MDNYFLRKIFLKKINKSLIYNIFIDKVIHLTNVVTVNNKIVIVFKK